MSWFYSQKSFWDYLLFLVAYLPYGIDSVKVVILYNNDHFLSSPFEHIFVAFIPVVIVFIQDIQCWIELCWGKLASLFMIL